MPFTLDAAKPFSSLIMLEKQIKEQLQDSQSTPVEIINETFAILKKLYETLSNQATNENKGKDSPTEQHEKQAIWQLAKQSLSYISTIEAASKAKYPLEEMYLYFRCWLTNEAKIPASPFKTQEIKIIELILEKLLSSKVDLLLHKFLAEADVALPPEGTSAALSISLKENSMIIFLEKIIRKAVTLTCRYEKQFSSVALINVAIVEEFLCEHDKSISKLRLLSPLLKEYRENILAGTPFENFFDILKKLSAEFPMLQEVDDELNALSLKYDEKFGLAQANDKQSTINAHEETIELFEIQSNNSLVGFNLTRQNQASDHSTQPSTSLPHSQGHLNKISRQRRRKRH